MTSFRLLLTLIKVAFIIGAGFVDAFPNGAPAYVCDSMKPDPNVHGPQLDPVSFPCPFVTQSDKVYLATLLQLHASFSWIVIAFRSRYYLAKFWKFVSSRSMRRNLLVIPVFFSFVLQRYYSMVCRTIITRLHFLCAVFIELRCATCYFRIQLWLKVFYWWRVTSTMKQWANFWTLPTAKRWIVSKVSRYYSSII